DPELEAEIPRSTVRSLRPATPEELLERTARVHDYVLVRRDEVRRRIAALERAGDTRGLRRLRRELARLEAAEPEGRERVGRRAAELAPPSGPVPSEPVPSEPVPSEPPPE